MDLFVLKSYQFAYIIFVFILKYNFYKYMIFIKPADIFHAVEIHRLIPNDSFLITFRECVTLPWASFLFLCVPQIHSFSFGSFPPAEGSDLQMTFTQPFPGPPFINPTGLQLRAVWLHFTHCEWKYGHDFAHLIFVALYLVLYTFM